MSYLRDDAAHWFARAAELRTLAAEIAGPETKRMVLELADDCTALTQSAEARADALVETNERSD
jgi:hypothetical protein